ncbi:AMP-binding protein [Actinomadura bangladeshensis]|uniref:AMP-dependent synthetase n=1 Tax=Actinomadura bangladeshensis TaxID=453573 RepID=A0A4V2XP24_9ACTN|nr:AMP-binding protein [Actinomadura bangladeshensis]TDC20346.1 AMP-dependent synthetase [Actinomadura bangladeshensis]
MATRPDTTLCLHDIQEEQARSSPGVCAVVEDGVRFDHRTAHQRVLRLTTVLRAAGVGPGDRIAWLGPNSFRVVELMVAAGRLRAMVCPLNWRQSTEELEFVLADLAPTVVVHFPEGGSGEPGPRLRTAAAAATWYAVDGSAEGYESVVAAAGPDLGPAQRDPSAPVLIMYTAAHEGRPNGALMTHQGLIAAGVVHAVMHGAFDGGRPVFLAALPLYHIATFMGCLSTLLLGGTVVYLPRASAEDIGRLLASEQCTWAYLTGPIVGQVAEAVEMAGSSLPSFRTPAAYVAADPRWASLGTPSQAPWSLHPGAFGQTELTGIVTYTALAVGAEGAAGRPSPWSLVRVVDTDDEDVPQGEPGEIIVRGVTAGAGYWNRDEVNTRRSRGGWWHTGDLGRRESDGSLSFIGPKTRMVKSGKENIYPAEVERCLREHPAIADVAVLGVPDPVWEQSVKAVVVLAAGATLTEDEVVAHCRERIASYKKPRHVVFAADLPRKDGRVDRDELDHLYGGGGYPGVGA